MCVALLPLTEKRLPLMMTCFIVTCVDVMTGEIKFAVKDEIEVKKADVDMKLFALGKIFLFIK